MTDKEYVLDEFSRWFMFSDITRLALKKLTVMEIQALERDINENMKDTGSLK